MSVHPLSSPVGELWRGHRILGVADRSRGAVVSTPQAASRTPKTIDGIIYELDAESIRSAHHGAEGYRGRLCGGESWTARLTRRQARGLRPGEVARIVRPRASRIVRAGTPAG